MPFKTMLHQYLNRALRHSATALGWKRWPTILNGRIESLTRECWSDVITRIEPYTLDVMSSTLGPGDCFWDIGAHHGLISLQAKRLVGSIGHVVAIEPEPGNFELLSKNVSHFPGMHCIRSGAGAQIGHQSFFSNGAVTFGSYIDGVTALNLQWGPTKEIHEIKTPITTLDKLAESYPKPTLIKIDVEGFELEVLKGSHHLLKDGKAAWLIEVHPLQIQMNGQSASEVEKILQSYGYNPKRIESHGAIYTLFVEAIRK